MDHPVDYPHPCCLTYLLPKCVIITLKGSVNTRVIEGINTPINKGQKLESLLVEGEDKIKILLKFLLMDHRKIRDRTKKLVLCHPKKKTVDLTATSSYDPTSVNNTDDEELVVTRATIDKAKS